MLNFINSNVLIAIVTLLVGGFTLFTYYKEKNSRKRDVAKLILQEIRYAENKIKEYRTHKRYKLHYRLLPTNSWNNNIHLFITNFEQSEVDLISSFYSQTNYIDNVIQKISDDILKQKPFSAALPMPMPVAMPIPPMQLQPTQSFRVVNQPQRIIFSVDAQKILEETSVSIELVYNTPTISKLKKLSEKRWYQV